MFVKGSCPEVSYLMCAIMCTESGDFAVLILSPADSKAEAANDVSGA